MCSKRFYFAAVKVLATVVVVASVVQAGPPQPPIITSGEFVRGDFSGNGAEDDAKVDWVTFHVDARTTVNFDALINESIYTGDLNGDGEITRADGGMVLFDQQGNILVDHDDTDDPAGVGGLYGYLDGKFDYTFETAGTYTLAISANGYWFSGEHALEGYIDYRIVGAAFRDQDGYDLDHADWQLVLTVSRGSVSHVSVNTLGTPATPNPVEAAACTYLWPPNQELADVGMPFDPTVDLLIFSNEADEGEADAQFDSEGALWLRAERTGEGIGRVYLIMVLSAENGEVLDCTAIVVPHDKSQASMAAIEQEATMARIDCMLTGEAPQGYAFVAGSPLP